MALSEREQEVTEAIAAGEGELVELTSALVGFDTTAREVGDPARDEAALQDYLAERLRAAGAEVDVWEPDAEEMAGKPLVPPGLDFAGRPQLAARFSGSGNGRSLLLNGHIDAVSAEPKDQWTSDPHRAEVRDGKLYGRGSADMKGGVAAMTFAAEVLARLGIRLAGDLLVTTNTDEESSGAGGMALVQHGLRADGGIVTEPTSFEVWVACRGSTYAKITVPGRPGHAETHQPHWREGGAVNAIEKATIVLETIRRLREEWSSNGGDSHPYLSPGNMVPAVIAGGEWVVTYPASCRISAGVMFLPEQGDEEGWGTEVEREVTERIRSDAAAADDWLAEHPPEIEWGTPVPAMEIPPDDPIVGTTSEAAADVGLTTRLWGLDSWYDGATYTLFAGTPSIAFGPRSIDTAHRIDEFVPVEDLVACAQAIGVAAMRFCGEAS